MFSQLLSVEWGQLLREAMIAFAVIALAPALGLTLIALAFIFLPAAVVGLPFMAPALLKTAATQHHEDIVRAHDHELAHAHA